MLHTHSKAHPATVDWVMEGLGKPEIDVILSMATIRRFQAKEVIFRSGELAKHLYLLRERSVKFYRISHAVTASRLLNKFQRMGAVKKGRGKVLIECPEKLLIEVP
jgi:hypothetical protein